MRPDAPSENSGLKILLENRISIEVAEQFSATALLRLLTVLEKW